MQGVLGTGYRIALPRGLTPRSLRFEAGWTSWFLRHLARDGLTGADRASYAVLLACCEHAPPGDVVDIGANIGPYSWLAAAAGRRTTAFEPVDDLRDLLDRIARRNSLTIDSSPVALADHQGRSTFYLSDQSDASNSLAAGFRRSSRTLEVEVDMLDHQVRLRGLRPAVLKIDTESTEPAVFRGAAEVIEAHRPWIVCEVLAHRTELELEHELERHGYLRYHIVDRFPLARRDVVVGDPDHRHLNWLFVPSEPTAAFWHSAQRWYDALAGAGPILPLAERARRRGGAWWRAGRRRAGWVRARIRSR